MRGLTWTVAVSSDCAWVVVVMSTVAQRVVIEMSISFKQVGIVDLLLIGIFEGDFDVEVALGEEEYWCEQ